MGENFKNLINLGDKSRNTSVTTSVISSVNAETASVTSEAYSTASETVTSPASASVSSEDDGYLSHGELDSQSSSSLPFSDMTSKKQNFLSILKEQTHVSKTASKQIQWKKFMANDSELQFEYQISPHHTPVLPSQASLQIPASPKGVGHSE